MEKLKQVSNINHDAMGALIAVHKALDNGDAVCIFPEGGSRFHPTIAPMKTGGG